MTIIPVYKPEGVESSEVVRVYKDRFPGYSLMHAGALDPLAEGLLLVVAGAENQSDIATLIGAEKTYEFEILLGFKTDTWDVLGIAKSIALPITHLDTIADISEQFIRTYIGSVRQRVPIFSNMRYRDKRMYQWAREGNAHLVPPLFRERMIYAVEFGGIRVLTVQELYAAIRSKVGAVHGDFRQTEILNYWETVFDRLPREMIFPVVRCTVACESGTYVRSIAYALGEHTALGGVSWHIRRTRVGAYTLDEAEKFVR